MMENSRLGIIKKKKQTHPAFQRENKSHFDGG